MKEKKIINQELGITIVLNKFAEQADGSVWLEKGGTVLLATVVREESLDFPGFFPLSVDYRELFSAAGKIPGGYMKREGKQSNKEVLTSRLIDRCLRPLFPSNFFDKVHVVVTVYSIDKENLPGPLALLASSIALSISNIPFLESVGCCELARVGSSWIPFPTHEQTTMSDVSLVVGGTMDGINMVEGAFSGLSEKDLVDGFFTAHAHIQKQVAWQKTIQSEMSIVKNNNAVDVFHIAYWQDLARIFLTKERVGGMFAVDKQTRVANRKALWNAFLNTYEQEIKEKNVSKSIIEYAFNVVLQEGITSGIFDRKSRLDGRGFDEIRQISGEVGLLPKNHGSGLFTRGQTQLLASVTLGSSNDEQKVELLIDDPSTQSFMLHYNFLPFSVGEAKPMRGPGRRELGHGSLAANALKAVLPDKDTFPYTIRIIADTLSSDGSTSMATVCSSTLALMDAGVPLSNVVGGIAMGMLADSEGNLVTITDIAGIEDEFGLMDFKVAGTEEDVTAIQMDVKVKRGLDRAIFEAALEQAKRARVFIINKIKSVLAEPRKQLSTLVPQFVTIVIPKEKIGAVIGTGGKVIREITEKTGTNIAIEDSGMVKIFGHPGPLLDKAVNIIKLIAGDIAPGTKFEGIIKKQAEFGYFVELFTNIDGLVHISSINRQDQEKFKKMYQEKDKVSVIVVDYDPATSRIRLKIVQ